MKTTNVGSYFYPIVIASTRLMAVLITTIILTFSGFVGEMSQLLGLIPLACLWVMTANALYEQCVWHSELTNSPLPNGVKKMGRSYYLFANCNFWFYIPMFVVVIIMSLVHFDMALVTPLLANGS